MSKRRLITMIAMGAAALTLFITGCGNKNETNPLTTAEIKQLVNDYSTDKLQAKNASITSEQLVVTSDQNKQTTYNLPKDEFFVSIAPYVNQTHPCEIHSLTGCQGEMVHETFQVSVSDENGEKIIEDTFQTLDNGFIDLWLPRGQKFHVIIEQDGKMSEAEISTFEGDNTCITTMQLI